MSSWEEPPQTLAPDMEGTRWKVGFATPLRVTSLNDFEGDSLAITYFREDAFMYPWKMWSNIEIPVRIYGEVVETPVETPLGAVKCFVKVRAAAYVND